MDGKEVAKNTLENLDSLQNQVNSQKQDCNAVENSLNLDISSKETTLNEKQNDNKEISVKPNEQPKSYGTSAIILSVFGLVFGVILLVCYLLLNDKDAQMLPIFMYLLQGGYFIGLFCGVVCSIIGEVMGIVAIAKSTRRKISWVGFGISMVVLVLVLILAGYILLN